MQSWKIKRIKDTESTQSKGEYISSDTTWATNIIPESTWSKGETPSMEKPDYLEVWITDVNKDHSDENRKGYWTQITSDGLR
jgi:hypothetical protein